MSLTVALWVQMAFSSLHLHYHFHKAPPSLEQLFRSGGPSGVDSDQLAGPGLDGVGEAFLNGAQPVKNLLQNNFKRQKQPIPQQSLFTAKRQVASNSPSATAAVSPPGAPAVSAPVAPPAAHKAWNAPSFAAMRAFADNNFSASEQKEIAELLLNWEKTGVRPDTSQLSSQLQQKIIVAALAQIRGGATSA